MLVSIGCSSSCGNDDDDDDDDDGSAGVALETNASGDDDDADEAEGVAGEENEEEPQQDDELALEENHAASPAATSSPASAPAPSRAPEPVSDSTRRAAERVKAQGNAALKNGKLEEAVSFYGQAIALDPTSAVYLSNRSAAHAALHHYEQALADAKAAAALQPQWSKAHLRVAGALVGLGRHTDAAAAYAAALKCDPTNASIRAMVQAADEAARLEAALAAGSFDWLEEAGGVPPHPYYARGLARQDDYPMVVEYRSAMQDALEGIAAEEGAPVLRTPRGVAMKVDTIAQASFEKLTCLAKRTMVKTGGGNGGGSRGAVGVVAVKLWHFKRDWKDEAEGGAGGGVVGGDDGHAKRMARRAAAEHARLRKLSGCPHWLQLAADVASETEARIGGESYPAIYVEHFGGKDLAEWLPIDLPPRKVRDAMQPAAAAASKAAAADDSGSDLSDEEDDAEDGEELEAWHAAVAAYSPEQLRAELTLIKAVAIGVLRAMKEANEAGLRFEPDGSEGPFLSDVALAGGDAAAGRGKLAGAAAAVGAAAAPRVKLIDVETLGEFDEGDDRRFTAEPLVYSPLGEYVREWWEGTATKIGIRSAGELCRDERYLKVLNDFGTLNWLLFKWQPEQLHGDEVLHMMLHGAAPQQSATVDASVEAHWQNFMERCFVMLGPRRFDELQEITKSIQAGEMSGKDVVARSRYCMGREFEGLHGEYLGLLKQVGFSTGEK